MFGDASGYSHADGLAVTGLASRQGVPYSAPGVGGSVIFSRSLSLHSFVVLCAFKCFLVSSGGHLFIL